MRILPSLKSLRTKRVLAVVALLVVIYALSGFFLAPIVIEKTLPSAVEKNLNCTALLDDVAVNPFTLSLTARRFRIGFNDDTPFAGFERFHCNFQLSSLFRWALTFKTIEVDRPYLDLVLMEDGNLNLSRITPASNATDDSESDDGPVRLLVHSIAVTNGTLEFDNLRQDPPAVISFDPINLQLANISTLPGREGPYTLQAETGHGESLSWTGAISLAPFWSNGTLSFANVRAETIREFFLSSLQTAPLKGSLDLKTHYAFDTRGPDIRFTCSDMDAELRGMALQFEEDEQPFFNLARAWLEQGSFDLNKQRLDIGALRFDNGTLQASVGRNGTLNLAQAWHAPQVPGSTRNATDEDSSAPWEFLFPRVELSGLTLGIEDHSRATHLFVQTGDVDIGLSAALQTGDSFQALIDNADIVLTKISAGPLGNNPHASLARAELSGGRFDLARHSLSAERFSASNGTLRVERNVDGINWAGMIAQAGQASATPQSSEPRRQSDWIYSLEESQVSGLDVVFIDTTVQTDDPLIELLDVQASARQISTNSSFPVDLSFTVDQGGAFSANGTIEPRTGRMQAALRIEDLSLLPAQAYIDQFARLDLRSGTLNLEAALTGGGDGPGFPLDLSGVLRVNGFNLVEREANATLLGWENLHTDTLLLTLEPGKLEVENVEIMAPRGRLRIDEDKKVNVVEVFIKRGGNATEQAQSPPPARKKEPFPVQVNSLHLVDGVMEFTDLSLLLPFSSTIHHLDGYINGISSRSGTEADIKLDGQVDTYGQAKINGKMDFFAPKRFTDVTVVFDNVEMTNLNPYTATFAGRKIESGKLDLDLEYIIKNGTLLGDNQIIADQLTLGEKVDSPQAVSLPLELAIALLKDSSGTIDINLPMKGDLDNPEFSFGHLIGKAMFSLLTKIVTSPFRILGALIPDMQGDDIDRVTFEPGRSELSPPELEKIVKLAEALSQRPDIGLTIQGHAAFEIDEPALRDLALRQAVAGELGRRVEPGADPGPIDMESFKTQQVLKALLARRMGTLSLKEALSGMEQEGRNATAAISSRLYDQLHAAQELPAQALERLAAARAETVAEALAAKGGLAPQRMRIKPPPETQEKTQKPQVTFEVGISQSKPASGQLPVTQQE